MLSNGILRNWKRASAVIRLNDKLLISQWQAQSQFRGTCNAYIVEMELPTPFTGDGSTKSSLRYWQRITMTIMMLSADDDGNCEGGQQLMCSRIIRRWVHVETVFHSLRAKNICGGLDGGEKSISSGRRNYDNAAAALGIISFASSSSDEVGLSIDYLVRRRESIKESIANSVAVFVRQKLRIGNGATKERQSITATKFLSFLCLFLCTALDQLSIHTYIVFMYGKAAIELLSPALGLLDGQIIWNRKLFYELNKKQQQRQCI